MITKNAEAHLDDVLRSVAICDEVVILDSGSEDGTQGISENHGARWHVQSFAGFGPQKQAAMALAGNEWLWLLDADEIPDEELSRAVCALDLPNQDPRTGFTMRRLNFIGGTPIRHGSWNPDICLRLFHRSYGRMTDDLVHERVMHDGSLSRLPGLLNHYTYADYTGLFGTAYHELKATRYRRQGRSCSGPSLVLRAWWAFTKSYVLKRGFLDGRAGAMLAISEAVSTSLGIALASEEDWHPSESSR